MTYQDAGEGMNMGASRTVSAFYDTRSQAEAAVQALHELGILDSQIRLTQGQKAEVASSGTADQGFFAMLGEMFFPSDDRSAYAEGLTRGGILLTVLNLVEDESDDVMDILDDEGAVDMDERTTTWREEGWSEAHVNGGQVGTGDEFAGTTGFDEDGLRSAHAPSPSGASGVGGVASAGGGTDLPGSSASAWMGSSPGAGTHGNVEAVEDRLRVGKRDGSRGSVRVRSYVVEEPGSETGNLREERVEIDRRPLDRSVAETETAGEYDQEAAAAKEARVAEEIRLRRTTEQHKEAVLDALRHTEVEFDDDREDTLPSTGARNS